MSPSANTAIEDTELQRRIIRVRGLVQGVGFRPYVYRMARELDLCGRVRNTSEGVEIDVEGSLGRLADLGERLVDRPPPHSRISGISWVQAVPIGRDDFRIVESAPAGQPLAVVPPDLATCDACLQELLDPDDRRYRYPFINCTNCGPRFSIMSGSLPYDRDRTTMRGFHMCSKCQSEYDDPLNRRFHAQPNACSNCGPSLKLLTPGGDCLGVSDEGIGIACDALRRGQIVAVKGIGGFHLMANALDHEAVCRLRTSKVRRAKPFAVMFPSLDVLQQECVPSQDEVALLQSPARPIVLISRLAAISGGARVCEAVAPRSPYLGALLPYAPLHHILMHDLGFPVVATSGNRHDEPICYENEDALRRLNGIADLFLVHDRPIARFVDDSVMRVMAEEPVFLRRARGHVPLPIDVDVDGAGILAVGAHQKNTIALGRDSVVYLSQHVGDLGTALADQAHLATISDLSNILCVTPGRIACDMHPDYGSTRWALSSGLQVSQVQHHHAHVVSVMAESNLHDEVLGIAWDGTGFGTDETIWGGEFLRASRRQFTRVAKLRPFGLPGGERAIRHPRLAAIGVLYECYGEDLWSHGELLPVRATPSVERRVLSRMLSARTSCPITTSAGRLFDAVSAIAGILQVSDFEGQAAIELESAGIGLDIDEDYSFVVQQKGETLVVDWIPLIVEIVEDVKAHCPTGIISARFHNSLAEMMVRIAHEIGLGDVVLAGGCFQNQRLLESAIARLKGEHFRVHWARRVPSNDGGLALGQLVVAASQEGGDQNVSGHSRQG